MKMIRLIPLLVGLAAGVWLVATTQAMAQPPRGDRGGGPGFRGPGGRPPSPAQMFERLDRDEDGELSKDEIPEFLRSRLTRADANDDGVISKDELARARAAMADRGGRGAPGPARDRRARDEDESAKDEAVDEEKKESEKPKTRQRDGRGRGERAPRARRERGSARPGPGARSRADRNRPSAPRLEDRVPSRRGGPMARDRGPRDVGPRAALAWRMRMQGPPHRSQAGREEWSRSAQLRRAYLAGAMSARQAMLQRARRDMPGRARFRFQARPQHAPWRVAQRGRMGGTAWQGKARGRGFQRPGPWARGATGGRGAGRSAAWRGFGPPRSPHRAMRGPGPRMEMPGPWKGRPSLGPRGPFGPPRPDRAQRMHERGGPPDFAARPPWMRQGTPPGPDGGRRRPGGPERKRPPMEDDDPSS
jgi:hypothetical protein